MHEIQLLFDNLSKKFKIHHNKARIRRLYTFEITFRGIVLRVISKSKSVPLQGRRDPEGSRKLRFPDFVTTA